MDWIGILGLGVGVLGVAYAIYENKEKKRLSDYIRAQNWHLFAKANNASGSIQVAVNKYKEGLSGNNVNLEAFEWFSKADAFGQDVFKDVVRQIQVTEPSFTRSDIERWVEQGRVPEKHAPLFLSLTPANM